MLLPYADIRKIRYIVMCMLPESEQSSFNSWADGITAKEQFWTGVKRFMSDNAILDAVFDYVEFEMQCLEYFIGVSIDANISAKNSD
jgi:hypothetical protein